MWDYNYDEFSTGDYNLNQFHGPDVGTKAPDFALKTPLGDEASLLDFDGDFLVLELGSITCPLFQGRREPMSDLVKKYSNVSFAVLYVREAHPGSKIPQHQSFEDKQLQAKALQEQDGEERLILIDGLDGIAHKAYGSFPNSVYIINGDVYY